MNADEIRAVAIVRVARRLTAPFDPGEEAFRMAEASVDALGDLLPTAVEKRLLDDGSAGFAITEGGRCKWFPTAGAQQRRYVTEWRAPVDAES